MSNFDTIPSFTESSEDDYYLIRRPDGDAKISKKNLFNSIYPIGTCLLFGKETSPESLGLAGVWRVIDADNGHLSTVSNFSPNLGTLTGATELTCPLVNHTHPSSTSTDGEHTHTLQSSNVTTRSDIENYDEEGSQDTREDCGSESDTSSTVHLSEHTHQVLVSSTGSTEPTMLIIPQFKRVLLWIREV